MGRIYLSFLLLFLFSNTASSKAIVVHSSDSQSILEYSNVIMDNGELPIQEIIRQNKLVPYKHKYINARMSQDTIWIEFSLKNTSKTVVDKVLVLSSPLLEHITLFQHAQWDKGITKGHAHTSDNHKTIFHHFHLSLEPESEQTYYLKVQSDHTPVDFAVTLENPKEFYSNDLKQQYITLVLAGVILALMFYSFILSFFIKDRSYFYYGLYLFALLYQQITYLGLTQIFFPEWFILFDMRISIGKVTFLIMTSALFAMHFLKIESHKTFYSIYKLFIVVTLIEMLFFSSGVAYNMYIVIMTGALFIIFNLFAAIHTFRNGHKEARLFIVGFGIVFVSYMMIIADALGFTSIMQYFQNILMWGTAVEAFVLSLAFADRYQILKDAKEQSDVRLLHESLKREELVGKEVEKKTDELNKALRNRETLLKEVHHRVKNNLQVILSMIRIQTNSADDEKTKETFMELQNRINTIAKTYMMLVEGEDLEHVDMDEYLSQLFTDIQYSLTDNRLQHISITSSIDLELSLYQAVCVGLILNELITNSYKHAFKGRRERVIEVRLEEKEGYCILHYMDNGKGIDITKPSKSMGGKLIQRLVADQLEGEINVSNESGTEYKIGFYK